MPMEWKNGLLAEGLRCYCNQEFFLAHEHWESVWLASAEPEKSFIQALIQITAAFHHLQRNNARGAASLLRRAVHRLESYPDTYAGVAVKPLRESLRAWMQAISSDTPPQLPIPRIR